MDLPIPSEKPNVVSLLVSWHKVHTRSSLVLINSSLDGVPGTRTCGVDRYYKLILQLELMELMIILCATTGDSYMHHTMMAIPKLPSMM